MQRIAAQLRRHIDILVLVSTGIFTAGMLWSSNMNAVAAVQADVSELKPKVESIGQVKTDVAAIKQKVDLIWDVMQKGRK